jgi:hypothetical protein
VKVEAPFCQQRRQASFYSAKDPSGLRGQPPKALVQSAAGLKLADFSGDGPSPLGVPAQETNDRPARDPQAQLVHGPTAAAFLTRDEALAAQGLVLLRGQLQIRQVIFSRFWPDSGWIIGLLMLAAPC